MKPALLMLLFMLAAVAAPLGASVEDDIHIRLKEKAVVDDKEVFLGQIAAISCQDRNLMRTLQDLPITKIALAGQTVDVRTDQVALKLRQVGVASNHCRIEATGPVSVTRRSNEISEKQIADAVRAFIAKRAPWNAEQMKIRYVNARQPLEVPSGRLSLQVTAPKHTDWLGAMPFYVNVKVDGQTVRRVNAAAYIEVWSDVVLAARPLGRNQPITSEDIKIEKMDLARVPVNAILNKDEILGYRTNRAIAANSVLRNDVVAMPPLVRKGDIVQVIAESEALRITTRGLARENGLKGDRIRVKNLRSKKTIYAQIVDANSVKVDF